jgi:hypothetical protein
MKMEAAYSSEALVCNNQTKCYNNPEDNMNIHDRIKLKKFQVSDINYFSWAKNAVYGGPTYFCRRKYSVTVKYFIYFHFHLY